MNRTKHWFTKVAGATALILSLSLLVPLLAYAQAYIFQASYDRSTGKVTASVYTDEKVTGNVYLNVHDNNKSIIDSVYRNAPSGSYTVGNAVYDRYDFTYTVTANVYDTLKLTSWYAGPDGNGTVTSDVYTVKSPTQNNGGGNNGGGGYFPWPPGTGPTTPPADNGATDGKVTVAADGKISAEELARELAANQTVTIVLPANGIALLPAKPLIEAKSDRILHLVNNEISLELPVSAVHFDDLGKMTSTDKERLTIRVEIAPVTGSALQKIKAEARAVGAKLASEPVQFSLTALGDNSREAEIDDFGRTYVKRTLPIHDPAADAAKLTGVVYDETADRFYFVPTGITMDKEGKRTTATLKRPSNSIYAVVERQKSFNDIANHWAKENIETMAGKLIIEGVTPLRFEPNRDITRAEFAALLVRALGIKIDTDAGTKFKDITNDIWYADIVSAASEAGLINGYPDGTFGPNRTITRAEMAAMMSRALAFTGSDTTVDQDSKESLLGKYSDRAKLRWAEADFAIVIRAEIVEGMTDKLLVPQANATRAQAAAMLHRFLNYVDFM